MKDEWLGFNEGSWTNRIDVRDFIQKNMKSYNGDEKFLKGKSERTSKVWSKCEQLLKEELKKHVLDIDVDHMS